MPVILNRQFSLDWLTMPSWRIISQGTFLISSWELPDIMDSSLAQGKMIEEPQDV